MSFHHCSTFGANVWRVNLSWTGLSVGTGPLYPPRSSLYLPLEAAAGAVLPAAAGAVVAAGAAAGAAGLAASAGLLSAGFGAAVGAAGAAGALQAAAICDVMFDTLADALRKPGRPVWQLQGLL